MVFLHNLTRGGNDGRLFFNSNAWQQVTPNVAFTRNADLAMDSSTLNHAVSAAMNRMLHEENNDNFDYYQLAWRLLGNYVDCNSIEQEGNPDDDGNNNSTNRGWCSRQLLFAVYANPHYKGGGIDEYTFYNRKKKKWECHGKRKCITRMDCHLPNTKWKLLGIFKIDNINRDNGWMEQTFKHEGVCVWGENTFEFASKMRQSIPERCEKVTFDGKTTLYYYTKPDKYGGITMGLYTDSMCSKEYTGRKKAFDVLQVIEANENDDSFIGYNEKTWKSFNKAMDVYKQCQPCIAYNLSNPYPTSDDEKAFSCHDRAGYLNCNQCGKFFEKSNAQVASKADMKLASKQRGLVSFSCNGTNYGSGGVGHSFPLFRFFLLGHGIVVIFLVLAAVVKKFGIMNKLRWRNENYLLKDMSGSKGSTFSSFATRVNAKAKAMGSSIYKKFKQSNAVGNNGRQDGNIEQLFESRTKCSTVIV